MSALEPVPEPGQALGPASARVRVPGQAPEQELERELAPVQEERAPERVPGPV